MSLLITTATEIEMRAVLGLSVKRKFPYGELFKEESKKNFYLVTGIGVINSAISLTKAVALNKIEGVINLGIAGSFNSERFPVLSAAVIEEEVWGEFGVKYGEFISCKELGFPLGKVGGERVWNRLKLNPDKVKDKLRLELPPFKKARSLTVSTVTGDFKKAQTLRRLFNVDLENMEGFSLAWVCIKEDIPFLQIRVISNLVGDIERNTWNLKGALEVLKEISRELIHYGETS